MRNCKKMLDVVYEYNINFGVKVDIDTSLIMSVNSDEVDEDRVLSLGVNPIKRAEEYKY